MKNKLFRQEVIWNQDSMTIGTVRLAAPIHHHIYSVLAVIITMAILSFLVFGHYTRHLPVSGMLVPSSGLLSVSNPLSGTVTKVLVHAGQRVHSGAPLVEISSNLYSPSMGLVNKIIQQSLLAEQNILHHSLRTQNSVSAIQGRMLTDKLHDLQVEYAQVTQEIAIQKADIRSTEDVLHEFLSVKGRGLVSDPELQQQRLSVYSAKSQLEELETHQTALAQEIDSTRHQLKKLPLTTQNQLSSIRSKLEALRQEQAKSSSSHSLILRAPRGGIVSSLAVNQGQAVSAGTTVLSIAPGHHDPLLAQLLVPSQTIGFLHRGSQVELHYAAFPYQDFGSFQGTVMSISPGALTPAEIATLTQTRSSTPVYRVMVALRHTAVLINGHICPLRSGMQLKAEVTLNRLRLIQWIFDPLLGLGHNVFFGSTHHATHPREHISPLQKVVKDPMTSIPAAA